MGAKAHYVRGRPESANSVKFGRNLQIWKCAGLSEIWWKRWESLQVKSENIGDKLPKNMPVYGNLGMLEGLARKCVGL